MSRLNTFLVISLSSRGLEIDSVNVQNKILFNKRLDNIVGIVIVLDNLSFFHMIHFATVPFMHTKIILI